MRICFFTKTIFNLGGVQRVVSVLANELSKEYDVTIVCSDDSAKEDRTLYNLSDLVKVNINPDLQNNNLLSKCIRKLLKELNNHTGILNNNAAINILKDIYYPYKVRENCIDYFNKEDFDIVIGVEGFYSVFLAIISEKINSKTIGWQHNTFDAYFNTKNKYYWNQDILFEKYLPKLNQYIVLTDLDKKNMNRNFDIDCNRIYNPLSFKSFQKSNCDQKVILFVGRLVINQKGIDLLIEAFNKIHDKCDGWVLKIVGDGPDRDEVLNMIRKYNLENKVIVEDFTNNIKEQYLGASIFVSTSRWEGFGLVITEAMECGLPVIAFENSGPSEIINNSPENGILIENQNVDMLAENMKKLMDNEKLRKNISNQSVLRADDFSVEKIVNEWKKYCEI